MEFGDLGLLVLLGRKTVKILIMIDSTPLFAINFESRLS
jgi:hypothetical protein